MIETVAQTAGSALSTAVGLNSKPALKSGEENRRLWQDKVDDASEPQKDLTLEELQRFDKELKDREKKRRNR